MFVVSGIVIVFLSLSLTFMRNVCIISFKLTFFLFLHDKQNRIRTSEGQTRAEHLAHLEKLKLQLSELEKQYEKSKPLVNLVDNMVKLGSLYRGGHHRHPNETATLDRLEFNQRIQERRLMQEEQRQWERMSPNQTELQVCLLACFMESL